MSKRQLTVSMLVSGREETTEKSLQSLEALKNELDIEIILVDTGCGKSLLEKIEKYADKIIPFTWCNDFAKARNVGLEAAQGEWFLFLDDDEWFDDITPIIDFFKSGEYREYHQGVYIARNYKNMEGTEYSDAWVSRMIRIEKDTHFEGRVHESLVPARGKCKKINAFVHHYGYVYTNEEERKKHVERNIAILEPLIIEEPENLRWRLQIIQEYMSMQMWEELRKNGENGLKIAEASEKPFHNLCRGSFYAAILLADVKAEKWDVLWEHYHIFMADERNPWNVRCALASMVTSGLTEVWRKGDKKGLLELCQEVDRVDGEAQKFKRVVEEDEFEKKECGENNFKENKFVGNKAAGNEFEENATAKAESTKKECARNQVAENLQEDKNLAQNNIRADKILPDFGEANETTAKAECAESMFKRKAVLEASEKTTLEKIIDCAQEYFHCLERYQSEQKEEQWQLIEESALLVAEYTTKQMQLKMCYLWAECMAEVLLDSDVQIVGKEDVQAVEDSQKVELSMEEHVQKAKKAHLYTKQLKLDAQVVHKNGVETELQAEKEMALVNSECLRCQSNLCTNKDTWLNNHLTYFEKWQYLLIEDIENKLCENGEFLAISNDLWKMAEAKLLPLEEMLLSLPMSQWMAQMMVLESKGYGAHWNNISQHLEKICSVDDIRYAFFDMKTEVAKMKQIYAQKENVQKMDYQTATQVLYDFAFANLHYADFVYTDEAFSDEMEFLPEEIRAAFWLGKAFGCEETDWSKKLESIKKAAKAWPLLGEIIKHYAVLIGEERDKAQVASKNAQNELFQMAESIKPQIYTMVENGMLQEALAVVKQLRGMVPEDVELMEMEKVLLEETDN